MLKRQRHIISLICVLTVILTGRPTPMLWAQETPRTDPTGSTSDSNVAPATRPTTMPATHPAAENQVLTNNFPVLRGREGFWRLGKDQSGVWWFVSPTGQREFLNTVTTVQPVLKGRQRNAADYISADFDLSGQTDTALDRWATATLARVKAAGFKGIGAWSHPVLHQHDIPITRDLNVWTWLRERTNRLYSPEWTEIAESTIRKQVEPLRDNRNLVGYYTDNELDWGDSAVGPGLYFDDLEPSDPNRVQVVKLIRQLWPTIAAFNADWNVSICDFTELDGWKTLPRQPAEAYRELGSKWLYTLATDYFRITTSLVKKYDPNHLVLGVRYRGYMVPEVVAASRDYTDAQSVNYYVADAMLDRKMFDSSYDASGQPIIITEYSFHALDGRSGNRNMVGFPSQVLDQQARAEAYKLFTTRLSRVPYIVGADWFQWMDEPPSGRLSDGEDANFGVVDVDDRTYELLTDAIKATTPVLNHLHEQSHRDEQKDVWRTPTETLPTVKIPYLTKAPRLNGEVSDWPQSARLPGVKAVRTVGAERSKLALPNMLVGWRDEGLYVAFEVFDDQVTAAPADGWWWSRDSIEFWVSTRPVASDRMSYDQNAHHFFFVPVDFPSRDGQGGVVGQWYVPGSAIRGTQLPHPEIRNAVRVLSDRYVVEIFIPASSLHGFDPSETTMAYNAQVKNYQQAAEYYWSAPKLVITQARPNTWGTIYLEPKPAGLQSLPIAGTDLSGAATGE